MIYLFSSASLYLMQCNSSHSLPSHNSEVKYFPTRTRFYLYTKFKFTSCRVSNSPTGEEHKPLSIPSLSLSFPTRKLKSRQGGNTYQTECAIILCLLALSWEIKEKKESGFSYFTFFCIVTTIIIN